MKLIRKGNPKGLDMDYTVLVDSVHDVISLHNSLLNRGFLFMYQKGDIQFNPHSRQMIILHYLDPKLKLHDYAIFFEDTIQAPKPPKETTPLDEAYNRAKTSPTFRKKLMEYMKYHKLLTAFRKHLKAYGNLSSKHTERLSLVLHQIERDTQIKLEKPPTSEALRGLDVRMKHFFEI
jgi:hypothetical protein